MPSLATGGGEGGERARVRVRGGGGREGEGRVGERDAERQRGKEGRMESEHDREGAPPLHCCFIFLRSFPPP